LPKTKIKKFLSSKTQKLGAPKNPELENCKRIVNIESKRFFANDKGEIKNDGYTRGSIFTDFNYGDFALVFPNPLVTFQKKETDKMIRDHVETHGPGTLEATSWVPSFCKAKPQGSREEQNKVARDYAE
jgi:hypothetical protein